MGNLFSWVLSLCSNGVQVDNGVNIAPITEQTREAVMYNNTGRQADTKYSNIQATGTHGSLNFKGNK